MIKKIARKILSFFGLNIRFAVVPGISFFGINIHRDVRKGSADFRGNYALEYCKNLDIKNVLDVGSGGGEHAQEFLDCGKDVLCIDFGTSVYAQEPKANKISVINEDFINFESDKKFDLIWASHVIEHQRNVGSFIDKAIQLCSEDGYVCITIPDPHRHLWGGHLTLWSPGLLAYNIVLAGIDISDAIFLRGTLESSIIFKLNKVNLPEDITYDSGDIKKLAHLMPSELNEGSDPWKINWK